MYTWTYTYMQFPVLTEMSVLLNHMLVLEGLKCAITTRGVPSAAIHGMMLMLQLPACNQDTHLTVYDNECRVDHMNEWVWEYVHRCIKLSWWMRYRI